MNSASGEKNNWEKTAYMGSKTVVLINSDIMTTLIPLYVKILMVHLQRAVEMSHFGNWKNSGIAATTNITVIIIRYRECYDIKRNLGILYIFFYF